MKTLCRALRVILFVNVLMVFPLFAQQQKFLWIDGEANFARLSSVDSIVYYMRLIKQTGFTGVVVDVKPITGEVLFACTAAPLMRDWHGFKRPDTFDFLQTCIEQAHANQLVIHASLNIFVAGHNFFDRGLVYKDKLHWQSINYTDSGMVPITKLKHKYSAMTNPALLEVQLHELQVLKELAASYKQLDGVILDRMRYDDMQADFSEESKMAFENFVGKKLQNYPGDIYTWRSESDSSITRAEGPLFREWLLWRASVIHDFAILARETVKTENPGLSFGDYTGAWYPLYYEVGVNWASKQYDPSKEYAWALPAYKNFGYAELLDLYMGGCYFYEVGIDEVLQANAQRGEAAMGKGKEYWYSVEGSADLMMQVTKGKVPALGSLYVEQYKSNPAQFERAVRMCMQKTNGLMIFDMVHLVQNNWWGVMQQAMQQK